jgi:hypothetical protein
MKTAISLPDALFEEVDATAKELGISRSQLIFSNDAEQARRPGDSTGHIPRIHRSPTPSSLDRLVLEGMIGWRRSFDAQRL